MQPIPLTSGVHDQQITACQLKGVTVLSLMAMAQLKIPARSQRQRGDRLALVDLRFVIGMPPHPVVPMAVEIEKTAIEMTAASCVDLVQHGHEPGGPAFSAMSGPAVPIGHVLFCQKHRQPRHRMVAAIHLNDRLLPLNPSHQGCEPIAGCERRQPAAMEGPRQGCRFKLDL